MMWLLSLAITLAIIPHGDGMRRILPGGGPVGSNNNDLLAEVLLEGADPGSRHQDDSQNPKKATLPGSPNQNAQKMKPGQYIFGHHTHHHEGSGRQSSSLLQSAQKRREEGRRLLLEQDKEKEQQRLRLHHEQHSEERSVLRHDHRAEAEDSHEHEHAHEHKQKNKEGHKQEHKQEHQHKKAHRVTSHEPDAGKQTEKPPYWWVSMLVGWAVALSVVGVVLVAAFLVEKILVYKREQEIQQRKAEREAKKSPGEGPRGPESTPGSSSSPKEDVSSPSSTFKKDAANWGEEELQILLSGGGPSRLDLFVELSASSADALGAKLDDLVQRASKCSKIDLSEAARVEVCSGLRRLVTAVRHIEERQTKSKEVVQTKWRDGVRKITAMQAVAGQFTTKLSEKPSPMLHEEVALHEWTKLDAATVEAGTNARYDMSSAAYTADGAFREVNVDPSEHASRVLSERWLEWAGFSLIFLCSQIVGVAYAVYLKERFPAMYDFLGFWVLISRGEAMAAIFLTVLMFLFMSRGFMTQARRYVGRFALLETIVDKHVAMHIATGVMLVFASLAHTIGHLLGSVPRIIAEEDNDKINAAFTYGTKIDHNFMSWGEALVSLPAVTGVLLLLVLAAFWTLSIEKTRRYWFELFYYPHFFLMALWVGLLILHGAKQWLGVGVPLGVLSALPAMIYYGIERYMHSRRSSHPDIKIVKAEVKRRLVMMEVDTGDSGFFYKTGMYCMLNAPEISQLEWHPFTIAGGAGKPRLLICFAVVGDWTMRLKDLIEEAKRKAQGDTPVYPTLCLRGGYGAPAQSVKKRRHAVMIGAGIGATPFLSFLAQVCDPDLHDAAGFRDIRFCRFYWVTREADDFLMINEYAQVIKESPHLNGRVEIRLCLSRSLETLASSSCSSAEVAAFWLGSQVVLADPLTSENLRKELGAPTSFGRPDWSAELKSVAEEVRERRRHYKEGDLTEEESVLDHEVSVYACGNSSLCQSVANACKSESCHDLSFRMFAESF